MGNNIRLFRLAGIPIELNLSWFLIFFLVVWSLAAQVFPMWRPGLAAPTYWAMGVVTALALFGSLLLHELAHSLMSRRYGIEVKRITLFLFGGVSEAGEEMPSPKAEFWIAIVGPLTSFALALLFFGAAAAAGVASAPTLAMTFSWLAALNGVLGLFNLIPGYPLDGGRVLRSIIWAVSHDMRKATRWASWGGKAFAVTLIGIGLARVFSGNWFGGFWLLFLGWLLFQAAAGSYTQLVLKQTLNEVRVDQLMAREVETLAPEMSLREAVETRFMRHSYGGYPVLADECLVGFVTRAEIQRVPAAQWEAVTVGEVMVPAASLPVVTPEDRVGDVLETLGARELGRVPVTRDGALVGLLSQSDIVRYLTWRDQGGGGGILG